MAISTTTTSALPSLNGAAGDMHFNTDTDQLVIFHSAGQGNYKQFSSDGTLGASIELAFGNGSGNDDTWYDSGGMGYFDMTTANLDGFYKRYESQSDALSAIEVLSDMSGGGTVGSGAIPGGGSDQGTNMAPSIYQSDSANAINATGGNPLLFVYTASVMNGPPVSQSVAWDDGVGGSGTYYYVPILYLINDASNSTAPMWGLNIVINEGSSLGFPMESDPSNSSSEWGTLNWGSGTVTTGNNEDTIRQALSGESVTANNGGNASSWTVTQTYHA